MKSQSTGGQPRRQGLSAGRMIGIGVTLGVLVLCAVACGTLVSFARSSGLFPAYSAGHVGDTFTYSGLSATLLSATRQDGTVNLVVSVKLRNDNDRQAQHYDCHDFSVEWSVSAGNADADDTFAHSSGALNMGSLAPGATVQGAMGFSIPTGDVGRLYLSWKPAYLSSYQWDLP